MLHTTHALFILISQYAELLRLFILTWKSGAKNIRVIATEITSESGAESTTAKGCYECIATINLTVVDERFAVPPSENDLVLHRTSA